MLLSTRGGGTGKILSFFDFFRSMEKMASDGPNGTLEVFVPTNPDLVDIFGRADLDFDNFYFSIFWTPHFWISRSPDLQIPRFLGSQISRFPDFQTPPAPLPPDELSDPNLTPLPTHTGIICVARSQEQLLQQSASLLAINSDVPWTE